MQYGKTAEMVTRLSEGDQSPLTSSLLRTRDTLRLLSAALCVADRASSTVDPSFRDEDGTWVGTSGRLRVLVYDSNALTPEQLPQRLEDLALPAWKGRVGWAPTNGSAHAHISALRHLWGEEKTRDWLVAMKANAPVSYPKNSPQVAAANEGTIAIGWVNHYYLHRLDSEGRRARNYSFTEAGDPGNVLMVSGVGVRKGSSKTEAAEAFIEWLLSAETQTYFAQRASIPDAPRN